MIVADFHFTINCNANANFQVEKLQDGSPGLYRVTGRFTNDESEFCEEYNTVRGIFMSDYVS